MTSEKFEDCLDIRQLVKNHLNLNQLLNLLLTPAQKFFFLHHKGRIIDPTETTTDTENDIWKFKDKTKLTKSQERYNDNIHELLNDFRAVSRLDRLLLSGLVRKNKKKKLP